MGTEEDQESEFMGVETHLILTTTHCMMNCERPDQVDVQWELSRLVAEKIQTKLVKEEEAINAAALQ